MIPFRFLATGGISTAIVLLLGSAPLHAADDITDRLVTDPLLRIVTLKPWVPAGDGPTRTAKRDTESDPPRYKRIWARDDVFMVEPLAEHKPGMIDFSAITSSNKGVLSIQARNHPTGDIIFELYKNDERLKQDTLRTQAWREYTVPFDHENVVAKVVANDWNCEFCFITYQIEKAP